MEHADFTKNYAVERYLLGEMNEDERAIFEEHWFDCRICGEEVVAGTRMMEAGRAVAQEAPAANVVPMPASRARWVPQAAAASVIFALLGGGAGYQFARAQHSDRQAATSLVTVHDLDTFRAGGEAPRVVHPGDSVRFNIVSPEQEYPAYEVEVQCGQKKEKAFVVSRGEAVEAKYLRVGELPAGRCELLIYGVPERGGSRQEIDRKPFQVGERRGSRTTAP
jgi:hypothetical protein